MGGMVRGGVRRSLVLELVVMLALALMVGAVVATAVCPRSAMAQRLGPEPKKKRSAFVSDTNDSRGLYDWGIRQIEHDPGAAAAAFYWAARLNPAFAEPLYARRAALQLNDAPGLQRMLSGYNKKPSKEELAQDSLLARALALNPLLYRRFDKTIITTAIRASAQRSMSPNDEMTPGELTFLIDRYLERADMYTQGWVAYSEGDFGKALARWATAEKSATYKAGIRIDRARIFGMRGQVDSAVAEFQGALEEMRKRESKDVVFLYNSKAMIEHSIGMLLEGNDDPNGAKEAYGRALQEDLSFAPAHVRLGLLALSRQDTTTALNELDVATQVAPDDPYVRYTFAYALASTKNPDRAIEHLEAAIKLEPLYPLPYALLGRIWEFKQDGPKAVAAYEAFLARASQGDTQRTEIATRLADVKAFLQAK